MKLLDLKITLLGIQPRVWRRFVVSPELTLDKMHRILQAVMGWRDTHLYRYRAGGCTYADPRLGLEGGSRDERAVRVSDLLSVPGSRMLYDYDFGDGWQHEIRCEGWVESDIQSPYALCASGARACPPEDCGGPPGYGDLLRALKCRRSRGEEVHAWVGGNFDPEAFSADDANAAVARIFQPKRAGKGRSN
jgi:hypothetical protein